MGRVTTVPEAAREDQEAGDDVRIVFDAPDTTWVEKVTDEDYPLNNP